MADEKKTEKKEAPVVTLSNGELTERLIALEKKVGKK